MPVIKTARRLAGYGARKVRSLTQRYLPAGSKKRKAAKVGVEVAGAAWAVDRLRPGGGKFEDRPRHDGGWSEPTPSGKFMSTARELCLDAQITNGHAPTDWTEEEMTYFTKTIPEKVREEQYSAMGEDWEEEVDYRDIW